MRLIIGLGNPGPEYAWTPHNLGFLVVDGLAERARIRVSHFEARSLLGRGRLAGQEVILAKPQTMMNLSGLATRALLERFELTPADLIVASDDVALPWGMIRVRPRGSAGGHNGLKSVIGALGTDELVRVRLGIRPENRSDDLAEYVLEPMDDPTLERAAETIEQAVQAIEVILERGTQQAMERFNRRVPPPEERSV
jgi:peptidyl-tRNA hydrolase, PTH1 family